MHDVVVVPGVGHRTAPLDLELHHRVLELPERQSTFVLQRRHYETHRIRRHILDFPIARRTKQQSKKETDKSKSSDQNDDKNKSEENVVSVVGQIKDDSDEEDEEDEFDDETLMERVLGLSEMFPPGLIKSVSNLGCKSVDGTKWVYSTGRNLTWMLFSTAAILFLPAMLESERVGFEEMEKAKRQQILLGPSSAMSAPETNAPLPPTPS